jgi:hypothetical protein
VGWGAAIRSGAWAAPGRAGSAIAKLLKGAPAIYRHAGCGVVLRRAALAGCREITQSSDTFAPAPAEPKAPDTAERRHVTVTFSELTRVVLQLGSCCIVNGNDSAVQISPIGRLPLEWKPVVTGAGLVPCKPSHPFPFRRATTPVTKGALDVDPGPAVAALKLGKRWTRPQRLPLDQGAAATSQPPRHGSGIEVRGLAAHGPKIERWR